MTTYATKSSADDIGRGSAQRLLRVLATAGATLMLVVIVSSAYLRLTQAGLSCNDWPACYGRVANAADVTTMQRGMRFAHRFAASAVGAALLAVVALALAQRPRLGRQAAIGGAGLAVVAALAGVGAVTSENASGVPLPTVTLVNLGGGFALLALFCWLRQTIVSAGPPSWQPTLPHWLPALSALTLAIVVAQILLGALVSAKFAALACPAFPLCGAEAAPNSLRSALDPLGALDVGPAGAVVRPRWLASLHWAHRVGALVVVAFGAVLAIALIRSRGDAKPPGVALALLVVVQLSLGAAAVLTGFPLFVVLAHNLAAALMLATLVVILCRVGDTRSA